jgi:hypothetical protein
MLLCSLARFATSWLYREIFSRNRRADRNPETSPKKNKPNPPTDVRVDSAASSSAIAVRTDIAHCIGNNPETLSRECTSLLVQDKFHPFNLQRYANQRRDLPRSLPFPFMWLLQYEFLEFSESRNSIYCRYCSMGFGPTVRQGPLITTPFPADGRVGAVKNHAAGNFHIQAASAARRFYQERNPLPLCPVPDDGPHNFQDDLPDTLVKQVDSIVKTVELLAKQDLAFRKESTRLTNDFPYDQNCLYNVLPWSYGNLEAALLYRVDAGDTDLLEHLRTANPKFISWRSQNKILKLMFDQLQSKTLAEARASPFFSIILDGTIDASGKEQLTFFLRYLRGNEIVEHFVEFIDASESGTGTAQLKCERKIKTFSHL